MIEKINYGGEEMQFVKKYYREIKIDFKLEDCINTS